MSAVITTLPVPAIKRAAPRFATNLTCLYVVHIFSYLVPFITVPYLARILGASGLGDYSFAESLGRYAALLIEYGFALSSTRDIARNQGDLKARSEVLAGVLGAQALVVFCLCIGGLVVEFVTPGIWARNGLLVAAVAWAIFDGCGLMWYFQGIEEVRLITVVDVLAKSCAIAGIFLLVRQPSDVWRVLSLRAASAAISVVMGLVIAYREVPWTAPTLRRAVDALKNGVSMFVYRSSTALSTASNVLVLGLVAPPHVVGYYAGAEKISKASISLLQPITQALLPRISHSVSNKKGHGDRLARLGLVLMGFGGVGLGVITYGLAPWIVRVFLGRGFEPAVVVLRILSVLQPVMALNNMLGFQWMLPLRMDRVFNGIAISAGLVNVALAVILSMLWAQTGPAWAVLIAQSFALILAITLLCRRKILPIGNITPTWMRGFKCSR